MNLKYLAFGILLFLLAGLILVYLANRPVPPQDIALTVSRNLEKEIEKANAEASLILASLHEPDYRLPSIKGLSFFLFDRGRLAEWSNNDFVPTSASVAQPFSIKLLKAGNGNYLAKRWQVNTSQFLVAVIPLIRNYTITNDYLKTEWNDRIFPSPGFDILESDANLGIPVAWGSVLLREFFAKRAALESGQKSCGCAADLNCNHIVSRHGVQIHKAYSCSGDSVGFVVWTADSGALRDGFSKFSGGAFELGPF